MAQTSFRDFAGAVMSGNAPAAATVLEELLDLDTAQATAAATHFLARMKDGGPGFMGKAMGLRTAVEGGSDADISALLTDCFGLDASTTGPAVVALRERYPS